MLFSTSTTRKGYEPLGHSSSGPGNCEDEDVESRPVISDDELETFRCALSASNTNTDHLTDEELEDVCNRTMSLLDESGILHEATQYLIKRFKDQPPSRPLTPRDLLSVEEWLEVFDRHGISDGNRGTSPAEEDDEGRGLKRRSPLGRLKDSIFGSHSKRSESDSAPPAPSDIVMSLLSSLTNTVHLTVRGNGSETPEANRVKLYRKVETLGDLGSIKTFVEEAKRNFNGPPPPGEINSMFNGII